MGDKEEDSERKRSANFSLCLTSALQRAFVIFDKPSTHFHVFWQNRSFPIHILCGLSEVYSNPMAMRPRLEQPKHHIPMFNSGVSRWYNQSSGDYILGLLLELLEIKFPPTGVALRMMCKLKSIGSHLFNMWREVENFTKA